MSDLRANGVAVLRATVTLPLLGRWWADLTLDTAAQVTGAMTLVDAAGSFRLAGTVLRGGGYAERGHVMLVGGAARLGDELPPHFYRGMPARIVAQDLLRDVGERLSPTSSATLDRTLATWSRRRGRAIAALEALAEYLGLTWRVLPSGEVWLGEETWSAVEPAGDVVDEDPADDRAACGFDPLPAGLLPGTTFRGRKVVRVVHQVLPDRFRTLVDFNAQGVDPGLASRRDLARAATAATGYHPPYPAEVVAQRADGTLDLVLEPDTLAERRTAPTMTEIPIRSLGPGITVTVAAGARVLVQFEHGDPTRPVATLFESAAGNITGLKLGANATKGVARGGDTTSNGTIAFAAVGAVITITYTPPGGAPQITTITLGGATAAVAGVGVATLSGAIDTSSVSTKIKAE